MPDCRSETTITQNTNKFVSGGFFGDEGGPGSYAVPVDRRSLPGKRTPIESGAAGGRRGGEVEVVVAGNSVPVELAMDLAAAYDPAEHVDYGEIERREREGERLPRAAGEDPVLQKPTEPTASSSSSASPARAALRRAAT